MKWGLKGGISIDTNSGPLGYVIWYCGSRSQDFFTFIQIGSGCGLVDAKIRPSDKDLPVSVTKLYLVSKSNHIWMSCLGPIFKNSDVLTC